MQIIRSLNSVVSSFDDQVSKVGQSKYVAVYSANALGSKGVQLGRTVTAKIDTYNSLTALLFHQKPLPFNLILTVLSVNRDGSGGAYHSTCGGNTIYVDVRTGANGQYEPPVSLAFFVAEATEVYEAWQGIGWNCSASNGEALSRIFAEAQFPGVLAGYESVPYWLNGDRADWISQTDPSDVHGSSIGCSVAFINFLYYQLGVNWFKIVASGAATLEETYRKCTGKTGGYAAMMEAINRKYPPGTNYPDIGIGTDNPFPIR